jgi:P-type Cu+ transporter
MRAAKPEDAKPDRKPDQKNAKPALSAGETKARDLVCGMLVDLHGSLRTLHAGHSYFFCSAACKERFEAMPSRFVPV